MTLFTKNPGLFEGNNSNPDHLLKGLFNRERITV